MKGRKCIAKLAAAMMVLVFGSMFTCPAISAVLQERPKHFCDHENSQPNNTNQHMMKCCDQEAVTVNQFWPTAGNQMDRVVPLMGPLTSAENAPAKFLRSTPFRYCKTEDHLASLSVLRI